jgi:hypothetical protein
MCRCARWAAAWKVIRGKGRHLAFDEVFLAPERLPAASCWATKKPWASPPLRFGAFASLVTKANGVAASHELIVNRLSLTVVRALRSIHRFLTLGALAALPSTRVGKGRNKIR